ncbi:TPA: hypothetical protein DIV55_03730 [Patescibacteria group bacterium]|uniref:Uncharacterized protein n=1 Tax=Candidatus Gottesmanbacteria bacterium GW2011_GWA1_43_11 TaxID=1618436 RepID=A0A0G1CKJ7_9BACT|nr:MAG: hypothetical protein UV59_C0003G0024 [Candidatus Gottesmanbacteria bacterium GW2011_GWA1_43_11]HCS78831.1 hypothetical protein [Patescibacteria group bacterium]
MDEHLHATIQTIQALVISLIVVLMPVFFLPVTADFYTVNKQALLLVGVSILTVLWVIETLVTNKIAIHKTRFTLPLSLFLIATIASAYLSSQNRMENWITPLGAGSILLLTFFYFFVSQQSKRAREIISYALLISGGLLAFVVFQQFVGVSSNLTKAAYLQSPSWTPTGATFSTFIYFLGLLIFAIPTTYMAIKANKTATIVVFSVAVILMLLGLGITTYQLFFAGAPLFLPLQSGWYIAVETLKDRLLFGYGPAHFLSAFTLHRPLALNATPFWNLRFVVSSNLYFHFWTTLGLFGLVSFLIFVAQSFLQLRTRVVEQLKFAVPLVVALVTSIFFPPAFLLLFLIYLFAGLASGHEEQHELSAEKLPVKLATVLPLLILGYALFITSRVYSSEVAFRKSITAAQNNKASETYQGHQEAIKLAPWNDKYRLSYAQINLVLAKAIAQKGNLTDQDRTTLTQLVQQSIQEAKNAVILNGNRVTNWENLANIYKQIMNVAQQADQWSVASYAQAIALDPFNPLLRIELGGIFYVRNNFPEAIKHFEMAVWLKPDLANARYNLANAYRQNKEYNKAAVELENTLKLVTANSNDQKKVQAELDEVKKLVTTPGTNPPTQEIPSENLTTPETDSPEVNPPLDLPESAAPPATESANLTPSPSPVPSVSPEASP